MNIDEVRRSVVLGEWIEEMKTTRGVIENDSVEKTGLVSVRNEILNRIEDMILFAESKMPGFDPLSDVQMAPAKAEIRQKAASALPRHSTRNQLFPWRKK
jgi:hypothetical protein